MFLCLDKYKEVWYNAYGVMPFGVPYGAVASFFEEVSFAFLVEGGDINAVFDIE